MAPQSSSVASTYTPQHPDLHGQSSTHVSTHMYTHALIIILSIFSELNYFFLTVNVSKVIVMHFVLNMKQGSHKNSKHTKGRGIYSAPILFHHGHGYIIRLNGWKFFFNKKLPESFKFNEIFKSKDSCEYQTLNPSRAYF